MVDTVVELRQYTMRPGGRDVLIELFDREFVETQEALGIRVAGQFEDLDRPDRFVWLRSFADLPGRLAGLTAFYGGPVWKAHAAAANATMLDSDDVLLLRPVGAGIPPGDRSGPAGPVTATVYPVAGEAAEEELLDLLRAEADPLLAATGGRPVAELRTLTAVNDFPALPVREGEHVVVRIARHDGEAAQRAYGQGLAAVGPAVSSLLTGVPQHLRLRPTPRSALR